jgi:hypothetical protein
VPTLVEHGYLPLFACSELLFAVAADLRRVERPVDLEDQFPAKHVRLEPTDRFLGGSQPDLCSRQDSPRRAGSPDQCSR